MPNKRRWRKRLSALADKACLETLESRLLFSALTPAQVRHFYGVDNISFNGTTGNGAGQTIAIVDAYDQPDLLDSTDPNFDSSDLHQFDQMFGLPDPPSFVKIDEYGGTNLPTSPTYPHETDWSEEETLDVEWAHAMAPMANIVLVECNSASDADLFQAGISTAQNYPGVSVISMSFDETPEPSDIVSRDGTFSSTTGITYIASAGDYGSQNTGYPAFSSYVIGVGGTTVSLADGSGTYGSEVAWNNAAKGEGTGGAPSQYEPKPSYQSSETISGNYRGVPDVAFDADPATGVYIYDSAENPMYHGYSIGGTSVGVPCWSGLIAIANQGRALAGLTPLTGYTQTLPRLYSLSPSDFHDIVSGSNGQYGSGGYSAGPGYDMTTGLGTPIANLLVPDLAGGDTVTGQVFDDNHGNTTLQSNDTAVAGQTVYLDLNNSGSYVAGDPTAVTNASGIYTFSDLIGSLAGTVRLMTTPSGFFQIPNNATFFTSYDSTQTINFSLFPTTYSAPAGTNFTLNLDASGTVEQISVNGFATYSIPASLALGLTFSFMGAGNSLLVDASNGNPVTVGGITLAGNTAGSVLTVVGSQSGNDSFVVTSSTLSFNSNLINLANVSQLILNPGSGADSVQVDSGQAIIAAQSPGLGILTRQFSNLSVAPGGLLSFATAASHSDRTVVETSSLSVSGTLDLGGNDMIVQGGNLSSITALLASGYAGGTWTGTGISSTAAAADTTYLTALGVISNNNSGGTLYGGTGQPLFDGIAPQLSDILIKYTYYGDADLSGSVDGSDYSRIDNAVLLALTGWFNGDFNYDGSVNGSDYKLIDNAFLSQGSSM